MDKNNTIYFYGKKYEDVNISFDKPLFPKAYDLWYDKDSNQLLVYYPIEGGYEWIPVGTVINTPIKDVKLFDPETEWPSDAQTFLFDDHKYYFEPNTNALEIIIDNSSLMADQLTEVIEETNEYVKRGIGFRLIDPLDRPCIVECRVNHIITGFPLARTYQRAGMITDEYYCIFDGNINSEQKFQTAKSFVINEKQLEVFVNGRKLIFGLEFVEQTKDETDTTSDDTGNLSTCFKILTEIADGDYIAYKISRMLCTYETMYKYIEPLDMQVKDHEKRLAKLEMDFVHLSENVLDKLNIFDTMLIDLEDKIHELDTTCYKKTDSIAKESLPEYIDKSLFKDYENYICEAEALTKIQGKASDVLTVFYNRDRNSKALIKDADYTVSATDNELAIYLDSGLVSSDATIYITIIRFGVDG